MDWLLHHLQEPTTLFLSNSKLLTHLTEWYDDGRSRKLILKRGGESDSPVQAEVKWIAAISAENFQLTVDSGWKEFENPAWNKPFVKTKASCHLVCPKPLSLAQLWAVASQGANNIMEANTSHQLSEYNKLIFSDKMKIRHMCFKVLATQSTPQPHN